MLLYASNNNSVMQVNNLRKICAATACLKYFENEELVDLRIVEPPSVPVRILLRVIARRNPLYFPGKEFSIFIQRKHIFFPLTKILFLLLVIAALHW